jgi:hypothetical protein
MKRLVFVNLFLFVVLLFALFYYFDPFRTFHSEFTFNSFLADNYNLNKYPPGSIGVLYLTRDIKTGQPKLAEILSEFKKYRNLKSNVFPFLYYDKTIKPTIELPTDIPIKNGGFNDIGRFFEVTIGKTVVFKIANGEILYTYNFYINPYTIMEVLNEKKS